jgi:hypothetical protein
LRSHWSHETWEFCAPEFGRSRTSGVFGLLAQYAFRTETKSPQ